jgi:hypothetical protein
MFGRIKSLLPFHLGTTLSSVGDEHVREPPVCLQNVSTPDLADVMAAMHSDGAAFDNNSTDYQGPKDCSEYGPIPSDCAVGKTMLDDSEDFQVDRIFPSVSDAKLKASAFSGCPVTQRSAKKQKYIYLECFRSGKARTIATADKQRRLLTKNGHVHLKLH